MNTETTRIKQAHSAHGACPLRSDKAVTPKPPIEISSPTSVIVMSHLAQALRPIDGYSEYMASAAWRAKRKVEIDSSGNRCRGCNLSGDEIELQIHHRSYVNFGHELPDDLTALCIDCHPAITAVIRRRRYASREPLTGGVIDANCGTALFDPQVRGAWS
jgi:hypothetical protein